MINIKDDYAKVGVPMLPVVAGEAATAKQVWYYTLGLVPISLLPVYPLGISGLVYGTIAALLGIIFIDKAGKLLKSPDNKDIAKSTFKYSILYMMLLCIGMAIDSIFIQ
jgi:heme o synthase